MLSLPSGGLAMRFFRPEIEKAFRMLGVAVLVTLIVLPVAWGYEQRKQARTWQKVACAYRMREIVRNTPIVASVEYRRDACTALERLGLDLELPR